MALPWRVGRGAGGRLPRDGARPVGREASPAWSWSWRGGEERRGERQVPEEEGEQEMGEGKVRKRQSRTQ